MCLTSWIAAGRPRFTVSDWRLSHRLHHPAGFAASLPLRQGFTQPTNRQERPIWSSGARLSVREPRSLIFSEASLGLALTQDRTQMAFYKGMAYSVFTHIPEQVHRHRLLELTRVMQPGAVFSFTVEPRRFIDFIESVPDETSHPWHHALHAYAAGANEFRIIYDSGQLVYLPTGGGDFRGTDVYGDAIVPLAYIEANWAPY